MGYLIAFLLILASVGIVGWLVWKRFQKRNFDMTPRDKNGDELDEDEDEEDDPSKAPVYEDDFSFYDWMTLEDMMAEIGVLDVRDSMIEYETGNNSRMFVMLAEMAQSNNRLKTTEEIAESSAFMEIFYNGLNYPIKITTQSQRVEMTDFLNQLRDHSQYMRGSNKQMREYALHVINKTLNYQRATDRFENRTYIQFMCMVQPDEVYGNNPDTIERQIHEKAYSKLMRQIIRGDKILRRAGHPLQPLNNFGLLEVLYKTFNRESSVKVRFEDIVKKQRYSLFTTGKQDAKHFKEINQRIQIEEDLIDHARDSLWMQQQIKNNKKLQKGEDYGTNIEDQNDEDGDDNIDPLDIDNMQNFD